MFVVVVVYFSSAWRGLQSILVNSYNFFFFFSPSHSLCTVLQARKRHLVQVWLPRAVWLANVSQVPRDSKFWWFTRATSITVYENQKYTLWKTLSFFIHTDTSLTENNSVLNYCVGASHWSILELKEMSIGTTRCRQSICRFKAS